MYKQRKDKNSSLEKVQIKRGAWRFVKITIITGVEDGFFNLSISKNSKSEGEFMINKI